jgi:hypothetical protein
MERQFSFYNSEVSKFSMSGKTYRSEKSDITLYKVYYFILYDRNGLFIQTIATLPTEYRFVIFLFLFYSVLVSFVKWKLKWNTAVCIKSMIFFMVAVAFEFYLFFNILQKTHLNWFEHVFWVFIPKIDKNKYILVCQYFSGIGSNTSLKKNIRIVKKIWRHLIFK